jgi:hypothetical protein
MDSITVKRLPHYMEHADGKRWVVTKVEGGTVNKVVAGPFKDKLIAESAILSADLFNLKHEVIAWRE